MTPAYIFIRDDDVMRMDDSFSWFYRAALRYQIPVVYAVIPGKMDARLMRTFRQQKKQTPGLIDIVQHGWQHVNYAAAGERKYEFGPSRTLAQQGADISQGKEVMLESFGCDFTQVFVPPFHGYDPVTLDLVADHGFCGFSAGEKAASLSANVIDMPARVSWGAKNRDEGYQKLLLSVSRQVSPGRLTGILFHHAELSSAGMEDALIMFFRGLLRWREKGSIKIILLSDILALL